MSDHPTKVGTTNAQGAAAATSADFRRYGAQPAQCQGKSDAQPTVDRTKRVSSEGSARPSRNARSNLVTLTPQLAVVAGEDAANKRMRAAGRTKWNRADYNLACRTQATLLLQLGGVHAAAARDVFGTGMSAREDLTLERVEAVRFALGHARDIHAVCDMAARWLNVAPSVERFANSLSVKDCARLLKAMGMELEVRA